eukprot:TRINITY_DN2408_c0_g1_i1.p2 TRINITY_DN2408_c0_g1~~TRINITY_DN2408_c0_g1_i1.p2  ORF type:complete len:174 (+),score=39.30 TRINITY_DN2408_c0_g1_i1:411-932(+)
MSGSDLPIQVQLTEPVRMVMSGHQQMAVISASGKVTLWRNGSARHLELPAPAIGIACSSNITLIVTQSGHVISVDKTNASQHSIPSLTDIVAVAAGIAHYGAVSASGELFTWGAHANGRLGVGSTLSADVEVPMRVMGGALGKRAVKRVAFGAEHSVCVAEPIPVPIPTVAQS